MHLENQVLTRALLKMHLTSSKILMCVLSFVHSFLSACLYFGTGYRYLADGSFKTAKTLIPELYDACETKTIRAFYQKTWRYMDAYSYVVLCFYIYLSPIQCRRGLNAHQAEYAVKKYRSHRRIGVRIMMDMEIMNNPA